MYVVAIAWIYVVLMVSVLQETVFRGIITFLFAGVMPLALLLFLVGTPQRRRNQKALSEQTAVDQVSDPRTLAEPIESDALANTPTPPWTDGTKGN